MNNNFTQIMSQKTNEELVKIVTVDREGYQNAAIEAAVKEIEKRDIDVSKIEDLKTTYIEIADQQKRIETNAVGAMTRFVHFMVDTFAVLIIVTLLGFLANPLVTYSNQYLFAFLLLELSFFGYYMLMEIKYQKTLGKFITKTKVVMKDGQKPGQGDIVRRTACRLIPFDQVSYFFAINGIHDYLSNTRVVKDEQ